MLKTNAARTLASAALALTLAACSGGSGGSSFQVATCSLGCSGGSGGQQITCGVVGVAENQEISLTFTAPVGSMSITKESFAVRDAITGASAPGTRFIDPNNPNRLIFRPKLNVGPTGDPIFGFETGRAYEVYLNGVAQNDPLPYLESAGGSPNVARVNCTVQANQGIVDTIPGKPSVQVFVTVVDPGTSAESVVEVQLGQLPGATNVKTLSSVRLEFDELMDISTMFNPSTGVSPNIDVLLDVDGNPLTTTDRALIIGSYSFGYDQTAQTTTLLFTPTDGFPSLGADVNNPRLVVVSLGPGITDIAGNGLDLPGTYNFVAQQVLFPSGTLPPGGEQFTSTALFDAKRSGSPWGTEVAGRLTPGEGGGSGRHGELLVGAGETVVLHSSPAKASVTIDFIEPATGEPNRPQDGDIVSFAGVDFTFRDAAAAEDEIQIQYDVALGSVHYTVSTLVDTLNAYTAANPGSPVAAATFTQAAYNRVLVEAVTPGIPSPTYGVALKVAPGHPQFATASASTLGGGFESHTYSDPAIVTNFDFSAGTGVPGGKPADLIVSDGVFEFSRVRVEPTGTLKLTGDGPVRILTRGDFVLSDQAVLDMAGESKPGHFSDSSYGQPGGAAGPGGGVGGRGGDRSDQPDMADTSGLGVTLANSSLNGAAGVGVGGIASTGEGLGGMRWPAVFPAWPVDVNPNENGGWSHNTGCTSGQMANTGSGGAYTLDGDDGDTQVVFPTGTVYTGASTIPNKPTMGNTLGGDAMDVGLEAASANPTGNRLLRPAAGDLRGGSGGGGGGAHTGQTLVQGFSGDCFTNIFLYQMTDNSGAGGGGGGGAVQVQAGGTLQLTGQIDAGGGDGGDFASSVDQFEINAAPGGGGSGGAVLLQGGTLNLANQPSRILVNGGIGGEGGYILAPSNAGDGSPGIVRVEQRGLGNGPDATDVAAIVFPTDPMDPTSVDWLSTGDWIFDKTEFDMGLLDEFEAVTGSQSCWLQIPGPFFSLTFESDPAAPAAPADMAWNMDVILDMGGGEIVVPWRGSDGNGPFLGMYPEEHWGTLLNRDLGVGESAAPIVVRFQGARVTETLVFPCDLNVNDPSGPVVVGSLTPWVRQPQELNPYLPLPTTMRFLILFDLSHPDFAMVKGVTNLRVEVQPE